MSIELGREIDSIGSRHAGNGNSGGSRRSQHQEKLKALEIKDKETFHPQAAD